MRDATNWPSALGSRLRFVRDDRAICAVVEAAQPFRRGKQHPRADEFAMLQDLWKLGKHRHLPLTQVLVSLERVQSRVPEYWNQYGPIPDEVREMMGEFSFEVVSQKLPGPFADGAELGRVRQTGKVRSAWPQMHMDPKLAIDIVFKKGTPPGYGRPVSSAMRAIRDAVATVLDAIKPLI